MGTDNLSPEAQQILVLAQQESENLKQYYLGVEHVFIALTKVEGGITQGVLKHFNLDPKVTRDALRRFTGIGDGNKYWDKPIVTPRYEKVLQAARSQAAKRNNAPIDEKDLLLAILNESESLPVRLLKKSNYNVPQMVRLAESEKIPVTAGKVPALSSTPLLDKFGRDITCLAKDGKIEPIIGRTEEILQLVRTLCRKTKNNPVLIGDSGVGKTAIVEGLALKIIEGKLTTSLRDKRIIELSMASIVAGTKYRGEFEERIIGIINESKNNPDTILFLDELHTLLGAGAAEGTLDASNILKPALARGEIKCIGATTINEYRKHIEKDPALERRFQTVIVNEPSPEETLEMLRKIKGKYENYHQLKISDSALENAVKLTVKYVPDRRLPDKALDALDEACSSVRIPSLNMGSDKAPKNTPPAEVTLENIAEVISRWTGIPVHQITIQEKERLNRMAEIIKQRIIGQDEAVNKVVQMVRMARAGLKNPKRPAAVLLFLGPTGVGKTELAKVTAEFIFGSENDIIRLDMSEYMEKYTVSRLIGSPPGYVGYEEEGQLTGRLRRKPFSIVLLDEIEKAHPEVLDIFLQLFDEGRLTDSKGKTVNATNAFFIMTSNIGSEIYGKGHVGFKVGTDTKEHESKEIINSCLKGYFRPEFLNRIDEVIVFNSLGRENIKSIARNLITGLENRLKLQGVKIQVSPEALEIVCREGFQPINGARPLARTIERLIAKPLSEKIIDGEFTTGDMVQIFAEDDKVILKKAQLK